MDRVEGPGGGKCKVVFLWPHYLSSTVWTGLLIRFPVFSLSHAIAPSASLADLFFLSAAVVRPLPYSKLPLLPIAYIIKYKFLTQIVEAIHNVHSVLATLIVLCYTPHLACWFLHLECLSPSAFLILKSFYLFFKTHAGIPSSMIEMLLLVPLG